MKRKIILLGAIAISGLAFSQVGVNTETPKSTFDVTAKKDGSGVPIVTDIAGMQAPRLTLAQLTAKGNSMYGADQVGALIYITDASGGGNTLQRVNITTTGYYYFDNVANVWQKVGSGTATGDTTDDAFVNDAGNTMVKLGTKADGTARAAGTDFAVKDNGQVLIGTDTPLAVNSAMEIERSTINNVYLRNYGPGSALEGPSFFFQNSGGTKAAPANLSNGNRVFALLGNPRTGGNFSSLVSKIISVYKGDGTTDLADIRFSTKTGKTSNDADMILDENGYVGIGTLTPSSQFEVLSGLSNATVIKMGNATQKLELGISATNNGPYITTAAGTANSLRLGVNGAEHVRIDATTASLGNVGIGTGNNAVSQALQVHRTGTATNVYTQITNGQTGSAATDGLLLGVEGTTGRAIINNQESSTMSFINAGTERMTILQNGNIGIGTTIPTSAKLHIDTTVSNEGFRLTDTTQGAGKVLTSDANGNASWQTPAAGGGTYTASNGLTMTTNDVKLGGNLGTNTTITGGTNTLTFSTTASGGNKFISDGTSGAPKSALQIQDGSQAAGKILTSDANGNATWVAPTERVLGVTSEITANYTLLAADDVVLFDNTAAIDFTLPTTGVAVGRKIYVSSKNTGVTNYKPDGVIRNASYNNLQAGTSAMLVFIGGGKWEVISGY